MTGPEKRGTVVGRILVGKLEHFIEEVASELGHTGNIHFCGHFYF